MKIKISPITNPRKGTKKMTNAEYANMHKKAFPSHRRTNKMTNAEYTKMHNRAFPSPRNNMNAYANMHKKAFPSHRRSKRSRSGSRRSRS